MLDCLLWVITAAAIQGSKEKAMEILSVWTIRVYWLLYIRVRLYAGSGACLLGMHWVGIYFY